MKKVKENFSKFSKNIKKTMNKTGKKIKNNFNKFKTFCINNKQDVIIVVLAILIFIAGIFAIGALYSFITIFIILLITYHKKLIELIKSKLNKKNKSGGKMNHTKKETKGNTTLKVKNNNKKANSKKTKKDKKKKKSKLKTFFKFLLLFILLIIIVVMIGAAWFIYTIIQDTPDFDPEKLYAQESTILYDNQGNIITKLGTEKREKIEYDQISQVLIDAIVATEDSRFFQHNGFDLPRFAIASIYQALGVDAGGASTLTMQVSKNNFTTSIDTGIEGIKRKFQDIYIAIFQIEENYTKEEIIEFYVNSYYMGAGAYGVEQASITYFGKSASDLNLAEAALIAGLFQAPNAYNPYTNPEGAEERQSTVLYLMERHGYITAEQRAAADAIPVTSLLTTKSAETQAYAGFIDTVVAEVEEDLGVNPYTTPLEIYTTMDRTQQEHVEWVYASYAWENEVVQAGVAVIDTNTGAITAIGNGRTLGERAGSSNVYNYATDINKQIGSTAKPIYDYAPAFEFNGASTYTLIADEPYEYTNGPSINNFDGKFKGLMTTRVALIESRNIPALKTFQSVDNNSIYNFAVGLGLTPESTNGFVHEAHSIGGYNGQSPLDLAAAYAAFGNGGYYTEPYSYTKVVFRETEEVFEQKSQKTRAMSDATAYMTADILSETADYTLSRYANVHGIDYGAKSGTTNFDQDTFDKYNLPNNAVNDLWVGSTNTDYSIGLWYGYDKIDPNYITIFGNSQQNKLHQAIALGIFKDNSGFTQPSSVVSVTVENETFPDAKLPSPYTPESMLITELFIKGTEPTEVSDRYSQLENVTTLDASLEGNKITVSWNGIATPNSINMEYLTPIYESMWTGTDPGYLASALASRQSYNDTVMGSIVYKVYTQDSTGNLTYIGETADTTFTYNPTTNKAVTFVIKSSYTIFTANESSGTTLTYTPVGLDSVVSIELNGNKNIHLVVGDDYEEPTPSVIVLENLVKVENGITIKTSIKRHSDGQTGSLTSIPIDTTTADKYTITYIVTYGDVTETLTREIEIKES